MRRSLCMFLALAACGTDAAPVPAGPPAAAVSSADLSTLRWIEGSWRAESLVGAPPIFFERYKFIDDSTLMVVSCPDAAMQVDPDTTWFELRAGRFANRGSKARFAADTLTATRVSFMPVGGATNRFTWEYSTPDEWSAQLSAPAEGDQPARSMIYYMRRVK